MNDLREDLQRASDAFGDPPFTLDGLDRRRRRRHALQRASSVVVAFGVVSLAGVLLWRGFAPAARPATTGTPPSGRIAFRVGEVGGSMEGIRLATALPDGRDRRVLVDGIPELLTGGWSPDATHIVLSRDPEPTPPGDVGIWRMAADGSGLVQLTDGEQPDFDAQWSPDGSRVLFIRHVDRRIRNDVGGWSAPGTKILVMEPDGSRVRELTSTELVHLEARWSPDGRSILFTAADRTRAGLGLYVMRSDGSRVRELFHGTVGTPQWSRDGREILFQSGPRLVALDVRDDSTREIVGDLHTDVVFRWSPDGSRILFTRPVSPARGEQLWVIHSDGSNAELVAERLEWREPHATWSPDGSHIAFVRAGDIWTVSTVGGSRERRVTDSDEYESAPMWGSG